MADESYTTLAMQVHDIVEDVPTSISGNSLLHAIDRSRITVEQYTGLSVGSPMIPDRFKSAVLNLTCATVCRAKALVGSDKAIRVGDFSVGGGTGDASSQQAIFFDQEAKMALQTIGRGARYGRTY